MLPIDDLIVIGPTGSGGAVNNRVLRTSNSSIGTQVSYPITSTSVPSFSTGVGRMLNLPRDVIFTMTIGMITMQVQNPAGPVMSTFSVAGKPVGLAMADFNGDGFADVALPTANTAGSTHAVSRPDLSGSCSTRTARSPSRLCSSPRRLRSKAPAVSPCWP